MTKGAIISLTGRRLMGGYYAVSAHDVVLLIDSKIRMYFVPESQDLPDKGQSKARANGLCLPLFVAGWMRALRPPSCVIRKSMAESLRKRQTDRNFFTSSPQISREETRRAANDWIPLSQ